jgi:hypothetical protein
MPSFVHLENLDMVWKSTHILSIDFTQRPEHHVEPMYNLSEAQVWPLAWSFHGMLFQFWATLKPCNFQDRSNFWLLSLWWSYSTPLGCAENILAFFGFLFFVPEDGPYFLLHFLFFYNGQPLHYRDAVWPMLALCWAHAWAFKGLLRLFAFYFEPMLGQLEFFRGWVCVELTGLDWAWLGCKKMYKS